MKSIKVLLLKTEIMFFFNNADKCSINTFQMLSVVLEDLIIFSITDAMLKVPKILEITLLNCVSTIKILVY